VRDMPLRPDGIVRPARCFRLVGVRRCPDPAVPGKLTCALHARAARLEPDPEAEGRAILRRLAAELPTGLAESPAARRTARRTMDGLADALARWRAAPSRRSARAAVDDALAAARSAWRQAAREGRRAARPERVAR
jgi:hypothetical protein